ncbi:MAG: glycosyltransferase [Prolixibacteraceae bacterium]|nr:glycosyltransferase [Prolixibacteraceae bacterium]
MNTGKNKRIIASVTNDLVTDNRVHKICTTLSKMGFEVVLVGRKLKNSIPVNRSYRTVRMKLVFTNGPLFYAEYNIRLYLLLLFSKADVLLSNDLDTLPANFLVSRVNRIPLIYDSHEYFTEVPELVNRPKVKRIWEILEEKLLPQLKYAYTVCESIAKVYNDKYSVPFKVVRNLPESSNKHTNADENATDKIVLYQGAINIGRGLEQAILATKYLENVKLIIIGDGDIKSELENLVETENLTDRVEFTGRLPFEKLAQITSTAHLGLSIEEDLGLNYRYALPNKLFDYIQAHVPVLITNLPEMAAIVNKYKIGEITDSLDPEKLVQSINDALQNKEKRIIWAENLPKAAKILNWENEEKIVKQIYSIFLNE